MIGFYLSGHPLDDYKDELNFFCNTKISDINEGLEKFKNRGEFKFAGIITSASHRATKTGKSFGSFVIEDYDDSITISIFGEDYLKFKQFLEPGEILFIKTTVKERGWGDEEQKRQCELKITQMQLLDSIVSSQTKRLLLYVPLDKISHEFSTNIGKFAKKSKGHSSLSIQVEDHSDQLSLTLNSRNLKINVKEFLLFKDQMPEIRNYKIE